MDAERRDHVNASYARKQINNLKAKLEKELPKNVRKLDNFIDSYHENISSYNHIESTIEEEEYKDRPEVMQFINNQRNKIDNNIKDFKRNEETYEEALELLKKANDELDDLI